MATPSDIQQSLSSLANDESFAATVEQIKPGTFERNPDDANYSARMIYTKALREYVYNPAMLNAIFSDKGLKETFFRTFGYQESMTFTMYPNVWLRDLPLLKFGHKVYMGDGMLLGTNQISPDQKTVKVGRIEIGDESIFDQQCAIGLGSSVGTHSQFGFRCAIGLKSSIGNNVRIREMTGIGNCVQIGDGTYIGQNCSIHDFVIIEPGTHIVDSTRIPGFSIVSNSGIRPRREVLGGEEKRKIYGH